MEWPPIRAIRLRSSSNLSTSQSTPGPDSVQSTFCFCVFVSAPLIPLVALVEFPPQNGDLSRRIQFPPCSSTVCDAENPARPPPTTIACWAGKTHAPLIDIFLESMGFGDPPEAPLLICRYFSLAPKTS